jgi:hypothetical protein
MQKLSELVSALSHDIKPLASDGSQFAGTFLHPHIYGRVPFDRAGESQHSIHFIYSRKQSFYLNRNVRFSGVATTSFCDVGRHLRWS